MIFVLRLRIRSFHFVKIGSNALQQDIIVEEYY